MTKSAMERKKVFNDFYFNVGRALIQMEEETRRLLSEEQAQKPTAPAGMIEELEKFSEVWCNPFWKEEISKLISRYRPAPSSDEGLRGAIEAWINKGVPRSEERRVGKECRL